MSTPSRPAFLEFLLKTKMGRMALLTALLSLLCFLVPYGCSRKAHTDAQALADASGRKAEKDAKEGEFPPSPIGIGETLTLGQKYDALISRYGGDLVSTKTDLESTRKELGALQATLKDERSAQEKERKQLGDYLKQLKDGLSRETGQAPAREAAPLDAATAERTDKGGSPGAPGGLRSIELGSAGVKEKKRADRAVRIPAGAGARATLLNGIFAPISGEPSPVRLRLDAAILGPNKARIPLRDSFLIGKAIGDPNSCRVSIQIDKFSTVKDKGEAIEVKALGYVVGEDGLEGVPGTYEWRAWEFVPLAMGTGGLQGISGALAQTQMTSTLNPLGGATNVLTGSSLKLAGFQAAGGASGKLAEIVGERMKEIRPAVSTAANRKVTIVFLEGVTLDGLGTEEIDYAKENDPFRGLDVHR
jgi:conjugal transfer pilus assembly protein TraB